MKKLISIVIILLVCANMQIVFASANSGKDKMESVPQTYKDLLNNEIEDWYRTEPNEGMTISADDAIFAYQIPSKFGEIWNKNGDIKDLINVSKKVIYCPIKIDNVLRGEYIINMNTDGNFSIEAICLTGITIYGGYLDWIEPIYKSDAFESIKNEIGVDDISEVYYLFSNRYQGYFIYLNTPKGEYIYPFAVSGVENKKVIKLDEFLSVREQTEKKMGSSKNNHSSEVLLLTGGCLIIAVTITLIAKKIMYKKSKAASKS